MKLFKNANDFSLFIEQKAVDEDTTCYHALLNYCEEQDVDPEDIAKSVSPQLKQKLAMEFADIGLLKRGAALDV